MGTVGVPFDANGEYIRTPYNTYVNGTAQHCVMFPRELVSVVGIFFGRKKKNFELDEF